MEPFSPLSQPEFPIEIAQGATFNLPVTYKDETTGTVINLIGYTAKMEIRKTADAINPAVVSCTTENGLVAITGAAGLVEIVIPAATTAAMDGDWYGVYDLFITSPAGIVERILSGQVYVSKRISK